MGSVSKRKPWSASKSIAFLVLFAVFIVVGMILAVGILGEGGSGAWLGVVLALCGIGGAVAAVVELVRLGRSRRAPNPDPISPDP